MKLKKNIFKLILSTTLFSNLSLSKENVENSFIIMAPNKLHIDRTLTFESSIFHPDNFKSWEESFEKMDAFNLHILAMQNLTGFEEKQTILKTLRNSRKEVFLTVSGLSKNACNIAKSECINDGGTGDSRDPICQDAFSKVGENSAIQMIEQIQDLMTLHEIGESTPIIDALHMDGPLKRATLCLPGSPNNSHCTNSCQFTLDRAIDELVDYVRIVSKHYPQLKFDYLFNFVNWRYSIDERGQNIIESLRGPGRSAGYDTDLRIVVDTLIQKLKKENLPIDYISNEGGAFIYENLNWDPNYPKGKKIDFYERLIAFTKQINSYGVKVSQAVNVTTIQNECNSVKNTPAYNICAWRRDHKAMEMQLVFINNLKKLRRGNSMTAIPESFSSYQWKNIPEHVIPENKSATFMNMFLEQYKEWQK